MAATRDAGITRDFTHEPLDNPRTEIRLVHVNLFGESDDEIECTISTHAVFDVPPYTAISYTWGNMNPKQTINLNGKRLCIGYNSWLVLWQTRLHQLTNPIWMDVLSIDQENPFEKSIQVAMMGSIHKAAVYTHVSLGSHADDSKLLADQIRTHADFIVDQLSVCADRIYQLEGCTLWDTNPPTGSTNAKTVVQTRISVRLVRTHFVDITTPKVTECAGFPSQSPTPKTNVPNVSCQFH